MKVVLPKPEVGKTILEFKEANLFIKGFFIKYTVTVNETSIEIEPNPGYKFNPTDLFHLGWAARECME
ncbi:hypothetical protein [Sphingobacterium siyangense]|uniref:hypothetical protein n=1 Tax=Sphingobacterium siyangense TaxID=459529 RepID=UPI0031F83059